MITSGNETKMGKKPKLTGKSADNKFQLMKNIINVMHFEFIRKARALKILTLIYTLRYDAVEYCLSFSEHKNVTKQKKK